MLSVKMTADSSMIWLRTQGSLLSRGFTAYGMPLSLCCHEPRIAGKATSAVLDPQLSNKQPTTVSLKPEWLSNIQPCCSNVTCLNLIGNLTNHLLCLWINCLPELMLKTPCSASLRTKRRASTVLLQDVFELQGRRSLSRFCSSS